MGNTKPSKISTFVYGFDALSNNDEITIAMDELLDKGIIKVPNLILTTPRGKNGFFFDQCKSPKKTLK